MLDENYEVAKNGIKYHQKTNVENNMNKGAFIPVINSPSPYIDTIALSVVV